MNAKKATFKILENMKPRDKFTGYGLSLKVKNMINEVHYPSTMLRYMREYRELSQREIVNVSKRKSLYEVMG